MGTKQSSWMGINSGGGFFLLRFVQTVLWRQWFGSLDFQESLPFALFLLFWFIVLSVGVIGRG